MCLFGFLVGSKPLVLSSLFVFPFKQTMIQRLLALLRDPDYRVRFSLARRIGILFLTWDGHAELFQDIWWVFLLLLVYMLLLELQCNSF